MLIETKIKLKGVLSMKNLYWEDYPMTGEVLVTFKGKPLITIDMVKREAEKVIESLDIESLDPEYKSPTNKSWCCDILEYMIRDKIVHEYTNEHNIKLTGDDILYYDAYDLLVGEEVHVSDAEVQVFYDKQELKDQEYDQSLKAIKAQLRHNKSNKLLREKLQELMRKYEIVVNEDYFKSDYVDIYDNK